MNHPFENLGPERFQQLCQALLVKEFPGTTCFPVGQPDGGRDALQRGPLLADESPSQSVAFQVKFARSIPDDIDAWIDAAVEGERPKIERLKARGVKKYFFISNVPGTAHLDVGSIDRVQARLSRSLAIEVACWWRDDLNRRLDGSWDVKLRYPDTLTGQDFLRLLFEAQDGMRHIERTNALRAFIVGQYAEDEEVKFKQVELQNKLLDLFVDLPFELHFKKWPDVFSVVNPSQLKLQLIHQETGHVLIPADSMEGPAAGTASLLLSEIEGPALSHVVIEGSPGQGKSTLAQYLCQVHRIRILGKQQDLDRLPIHHRSCPLFIPFKVDLRDLSDWLAGSDPFSSKQSAGPEVGVRSLETFLAYLVSHRSGGMKFDVNDLIAVSQASPLFIALDGLDEVADIRRRSEVVSAVTKACARLRETCQGLRLIVTSRPAAFANSPGFDGALFPYLQLGSVSRTQIGEYADRWINARGLGPNEKREFDRILSEKMDQPHLRDLAKNPMQLTILLSLIHTRGPALPDKRTTLYDQYVDLFFSRESTKNHLVRKHLDLLKDIHRYLAWRLHVAAESGKGAAAGRFTSEELRGVLREYLSAERQETVVVDEVFNAMLERVVMIVSRIEGTYEFEVQPLREYFAARYLYDTASYSPPGGERTGTKPDRFDAIAQNSYWLNVARFYCGCFSKGELLDLADRVKGLFDSASHGRTRHPTRLAAMLLSDWVFTQSQKALDEVAQQLATRVYLYRLLPSDGVYSGNETAQIHSDCGGKTIVAAAFSWLFDAGTRDDVASRLGMFVRANLDEDGIRAAWLGAKTQVSDVGTWLGLGADLGVLGSTDSEVVMRELGGAALDIAALSALWNAGKIELATGSEANVATLRSFMLSRLRWTPGGSAAAPLYLVPSILSHVQFVHHGQRYQSEIGDLHAAAKKFRESPPPRLETGSGAELDHKCHALSELVVRQFDLDISPYTQRWWEPVTGELHQAFGDSPTVLRFATQVAALPRGVGGRPRRVALFDSNQSLLSRLRFARSQSKSGEWWIGALAEASTPADRLLWNLAFWTWVPLPTIFECADALAERLDAIDAIEWHAHLSSIVPHLRLHGVAVGRKAAPTTFDTGSVRLAYMVGLKDRATYGDQVFLSHLKDHKPGLFGLSEFRQSAAFRTAMSGKLPWPTALEVIRETYKAGTAYAITPYVAEATAGRAMPEAVIEQVIANAFDYPCRLVDIAFVGASAASQKDVRAVGQIASKDHWFVE